MAVLEGVTHVTNYNDVKHTRPTNPSHGDNWFDGTIWRWYDSVNDKWIDKELKGEDGKDTFIQKAWSWNSKGTDRFTTIYPNENLALDSNAFITQTGETKRVEVSLKDKELQGKQVTISWEVNYQNVTNLTGSKRLQLNLAYTAGGKTVYKSVLEYPEIGSSVTKKRLNETYLIDSDATNIRLNMLIQGVEANQIQVGLPKLEFGEIDTIYTESPNDNFDNAYPKYEGYYSSHNPVQSQKPSDYTWSVIRGESGKDGNDGKDGKDGQTPKDVISGYLSNDSIIVPATPTGTVTDYSKAFGDFIVFEGQDKKTSGVTYSKVSEVGMTSSISSTGRYTVSALSADAGTATYRATYSGVTVDKILIVVKNKQGQSGVDGKDGVNGKDGSKGDKGATGNTGPKGDPTGITTSATVPTNPYINMLWQNTGSNNGYLTGVTYQWNGAKWNIFIFSAENIVTNSLSAISADLGNITAGTLTGAVVVSPFRRDAEAGDALQKKGQIELSHGRLVSFYDIENKMTKEVLAKGKVVFDEDGYSTELNSPSGVNLTKVSYLSDGIYMEDVNEPYGKVKLRYGNLLTMPETELSGTISFSAYGSNEDNKPTAQRSAGVVTLKGAFKNDVQISGNLNIVPMGRLPIWAYPKANVNIVAQSSGMDLFYLSVKTDGLIYMSKFGVGSLKNAPPGTRFDISFVYPAKINEESVFGEFR